MHVVVVVTLLFIAWSIINTVVYATTGSRFLVLTIGNGASMEPAIPDGKTLGISYYPVSLDEGDVVTFSGYNGGLVNHRIVEVEGEWFRAKGDNNPEHDGWIRKEEVVAKTLTVMGQPVFVPIGPRSLRRTVERFK